MAAGDAGMTGDGTGTVVVLGATGWIGRHVLAAHARTGRPAVAVAREPAPHLGGHPFHRLDLAEAGPEEMARLLEAHDARVVVNATDAANSRDGWHRPESELEKGNVGAVATLVDAVEAVERPPRLVHLGTLHEYGPVPDGTAVHEDTPPRPANAYARTKRAGSDTVVRAAREGRVDAVVLRVANVCGPHPSPASFPGVLLERFRRAVAGERVSLRVTGDRRDFVDVRDVARAVVLAGDRPGVSGRILNVGGGRAVGIGEMVAWLRRTSGVDPDRVQEVLEPVAGMGGGWMLADIAAAGRLLGWRPVVPVSDSLHDMWYA
ncbi:NAD-dependent epimerase/dehydratase family protein [Nocardiopsis lambiniae]|uniref:NAD-dependent epimerase/dehydratase family protein n=1 Tax=Nocardiopsis lambiniae TaxID=3075539 RepID=A0ABU2MA31_9ACTN|nr:NAD-dependent epimerase/dehydratase family protein [Nocardiopsis sp. DSM 44743]MDT0329528.1 NAD-dependent epimerase/dehydratase family protein [Nocardiopsis sp. DSM 44743]